MKHSRLLTTFTAFSLLLLAAGAARADYCITFTDFPGDFYVGRSFNLPGKGKCKTFTGFALVASGINPMTGTGCVSSDGSHFALTALYTEPEFGGGATFIASAILNLPAQTGTDVENGGSSFNVTGGKCSPPKPIPAVQRNTAPAQGGPGTH